MIARRHFVPWLLVVVTAPAVRAQTPPFVPTAAVAPAVVQLRAATPPVVVAPATAPATSAFTAPSLRLALQTEGAVGVATGTFYNHLMGGRLDLRFSPRVSLGAYLGYANLRGGSGRAHSALGYAQLEYVAGDPGATVRVPLRFATGYLGDNGPIVRAAAGFAFALAPKVDLVTELLAPMIWLTNNQMLLSLDLALELAVRL